MKLLALPPKAAVLCLAALVIPAVSFGTTVKATYPSGEATVESRMTVPPNVYDIFGTPLWMIRNEVRAFCGEPPAGNVKTANVARSSRPSSYSKTVREEELEDWQALAWFVEYEIVPHLDTDMRGDLCKTCSDLRDAHPVDFYKLEEYEWLDAGRKPCEECGGYFFLEPRRFALVRHTVTHTDMVHKTNPQRNYTKTKKGFKVLEVVGEDDFYGSRYLEELKRRRTRDSVWAEWLEKQRLKRLEMEEAKRDR